MAAIGYFIVSASRQARRLLPGRAYVFGREDGVDIPVQDALASRKHAELRWSDEHGWALVDLGSRNGTFVNSQRITQPTRLEDGTQMQVGGQVFRLHMLPPGGDPSSLSAQAPQISAQETMGPGFSLNDLATQGAAFTGAIVEGGVLELLQYFQQTGKSGRLDLLGGPSSASIWLTSGAPTHAILGTQSGFDALAILAKSPPPRFAFHSDAVVAPARTIQGSGAGVLMELARMMDEASK
ncbi:MAG TPA: hypothetical protein DCS97_07275 [Planctomycetes bacterium]|nr:hypothetical protein [Planctomycetota bacterium]